MILTFSFSVVALTTEKNYAENSLGNELKGSVINSSFVETEERGLGFIIRSLEMIQI